MSVNPYRPGFGVTPAVLAGRDPLIAGVVERLDGGAGFSHVFLGDRGVGKTVLLNAIEARAEELGWAVLHRQARTDGDLVGELLEALPDALSDAWGGGSKLSALVTEVTVGVNVGVARAEAKVRARDSAPRSPAYALERSLRMVGRHARDNRYGAGLLVTIDEAHQAGRADLATLGSVMQIVIEREALPVVVLLAALPQMSDALQHSGTFLERLDVSEVGLLPVVPARTALRGPATAEGVEITPDALELLVDAAGGYPYFVQLFGHHTWRAAAGANPIELAHARRGLAAARDHVERIYSARWHALPPHQQRYLEAMAAVDEPVVNVSAIAAALGQTLQQLSPARDRLIRDHHIIRPAGRGKLAFALPGFREWLRSSR